MIKLKAFFKTFKGLIKWQIENIAILTFNRSLLHADKEYIYYMNQGVMNIAQCVN